MKKWIAALLVLTTLLCCFGACAEATKLNENYDALDFFLDVPEGMTLEQMVFDPGMMGSVQVDALPDLIVMFSLMPDDSYTEADMSELSSADIIELTGMVEEDLGTAAGELYDMPCGLKAMALTSADGTEYILMTLKAGYFFYLEGVHFGTDDAEETQPLSAEEITTVKTVFDSLSYAENNK